MSKPTEPGYYWANDGGNWEIVKVERTDTGNLTIQFIAYEGVYDVDSYHSISGWGGRITQEPAPDLPPPF